MIDAAQKDRLDLKDQAGFQYTAVDGEKKDKHERTALFYACEHLNVKFVDFLLDELQSDPNQRCSDQQTAVHAALQYKGDHKREV